MERKGQAGDKHTLGGNGGRNNQLGQSHASRRTQADTNASVVETFAKRAKDAAFPVRATMEAAKAARKAAAADSDTSFADSFAMQE